MIFSLRYSEQVTWMASHRYEPRREFGMKKVSLIALAVCLLLSEAALSQTDNIDPLKDCTAIDQYSGSAFDWGEIKSNEDLETCLMSIAFLLGTTQQMEEWFQEEGFFGADTRSSIPGRSLVKAHWSEEKSGSSLPFEPDWPFWIRWLNRNHIYDVSVSYKNGTPAEANASYRTK